MKITREQLIKMIKEELGDPAGEAEAERQRRARTAWKRRFTSVEEVNAIADLMENDPEFEMLSRFAEEFRRRSQRGTPPQDVLEVVLPESVPGGLIAKVILKARERLPADETPIKKPKSPALSGAEMDRIAPSLEETKGNKMKITKKQLKEIIEEEFAAVLEQDAQAMMVRGAKGAGRDEISVEKIRISPDGSFKARLTSAALEKPLRVAGKLDHNSTALLQQANALEAPKELTGAAKEMMEYVERIKSNYEGSEAGMPPSLEELEKLVRSSDFAGINDNITTLWNDLLKWHRKTGIRLQHAVTTAFNTLNTLNYRARKQAG